MWGKVSLIPSQLGWVALLPPIFAIFMICLSQQTTLQEYLALLNRMDIVSLIIIIFLGMATFPLSFFVYFKLLTTHPFKQNYTFRLIVFAGIVVGFFFKKFFF